MNHLIKQQIINCYGKEPEPLDEISESVISKINYDSKDNVVDICMSFTEEFCKQILCPKLMPMPMGYGYKTNYFCIKTSEYIDPPRSGCIYQEDLDKYVVYNVLKS